MKIEEYERRSMQKLALSEARASRLQGKSNDFGLPIYGFSGGTGSMSAQRALRIDTFYTCVKDRAETIGQLPVKVYKYASDGSRIQIKNGRWWRILSQNPNSYMTTQEFGEMLSASLDTNGAFYAYKLYNDRGTLMEIIPFRFQSNVVPQMDQNGNVYYIYTRNDGKRGDAFREDDLLVVKNFTIDGFTPIRPLTYMANVLGVAETQEENYKESQENGITAQMALATDTQFTDENAIKRIKDDWSNFRGLKGLGHIPVLENGLKPVGLKLTPQESDLFNNREFSVKRIANMLGVPLYRVDPEGASTTKGTIPEQDEAYLRNKLNPVLRKYEKAINDITPDEIRIEVDRKAYYAGSPWRLVEHIEREVKGGLAMINEGREDLGREPIEGGDVFAIDNNNVTYGNWTELPAVRDQIYGNSRNKPKEPENDNQE